MSIQHFRSLIGTARTCLLCLLLAALVIGCTDSPQSRFEDELDNVFNKLIEELEAYAAGDTTEDAAGTATWYEGGQLMMNPEAVLPTDRSWFIISLAADIEEHFSYVSLEFLSQDPDDLDAWGASFQKRYQARQARVQAALDKVKERYRSYPNDYISVMFGPTLGLSSDDHLYFRRGDRGYFIDEMIDIDIDAWLAAVKEQMQELQ